MYFSVQTAATRVFSVGCFTLLSIECSNWAQFACFHIFLLKFASGVKSAAEYLASSFASAGFGDCSETLPEHLSANKKRKPTKLCRIDICLDLFFFGRSIN